MFINNAYAETTTTLPLQGTESLPKAPESIQSNWTSMVPIVLMCAVFYFLLIRPQEKRRREQADLVSGVKQGEEVMTNSGLFGVVTAVNDNDNTVELEIAKDVRVKLLKTAITDITSRKKDVIVKKTGKTK